MLLSFVTLMAFVTFTAAESTKTKEFSFSTETGEVTAAGVTCKWIEVKPGPNSRERLARGIRLYGCKGISGSLDCGYFGGFPVDCNKDMSYRDYLQDLAVEAMNGGRVCSTPEIIDRHCGQKYRCVHGPCKTKSEL
ncbi:uncharacterized protein LOC106161703 [Lingula anatina]|uniref:Uncharacterized protein LOC106161703 n=1 Tax=Lingula anatina TaxID=7574 RepID=A0A1S3I8I4_LINAN|nr:uncharacterized protein LOC106161703 [Lingula anatina]|eukprot:XP_013394176.1 uncharacterized protein LOC106161703 [Lingula anatina]